MFHLKNCGRFAATTFSIVFLALVPALLNAWSGATASPPDANTAAPINTSTNDQQKHGWVGLDSLSIFNHMIISGSANSPNTIRYLNFGSVWDANGYGIRDNSGTLEFKNSGGSWSSVQSTIYNYCAGGGCGSGAPTWASITGKPTNFVLNDNGNYSINSAHLLVNGATWASNWNWSGQGGQPSWLWGSNDGTNMYVWNPSNFNVSHATRAAGGDNNFNINGGGNNFYDNGDWLHIGGSKVTVDGSLTVAGNVTVGSATLATNGDLYMPWKGQWLSTALSQLGVPGNNTLWDTWYGSSYLGSNGNLYLGYRGQWLSTALDTALSTGRLGGQFWGASTGGQWYPNAQCPSGSVMVGLSGTGGIAYDVYALSQVTILCQWINQ